MVVFEQIHIVAFWDGGEKISLHELCATPELANTRRVSLLGGISSCRPTTPISGCPIRCSTSSASASGSGSFAWTSRLPILTSTTRGSWKPVPV